MLDNVAAFIDNFIHDESGQGIIEYAGVLAFAAGLIMVLTLQSTNLQNKITAVFNQVNNNLNTMGAIAAS